VSLRGKEGEKEKGEEEGEGSSKEDGEALTLEPMEDFGVPTRLRLTGKATPQNNMATISDALSIISNIIRTTGPGDVDSLVFTTVKLDPRLAEFGRALSVSSWADLPNDLFSNITIKV
jgi:hypothetical protein